MLQTEEADLRIADLREKIIHERMLQILVNKLDVKNEHWDKDNVGENGVVYYQTSFSRGKGITEAFVIINKDYRLMIQLQGEQYRRCVILRKTPNDNEKKRNNRKGRIIKKLKKNILWTDWEEDYDPQNSFGDYFKYSYKKIYFCDIIRKK